MLKYKKRLLLRCIHHFKLHTNNNMGHMRISVLNPRQWSLAKQSSLKMPEQVEAKRNGVIIPQNYNFNQINNYFIS